MTLNEQIVWFTVVQHLLSTSTMTIEEVIEAANKTASAYDQRFGAKMEKVS